MWLITPIGFFSIVQKPSDEQAGTLTVRARLRGDLDALKEQYLPGLDSIEESSDADYRFRASAPRGEVSAAMARLVDGLSYSNFKSEVAKRQGHARSNLYHDVWSVLYKLQTDRAFKEKERSTANDKKQAVVRVGTEGGEVALVGVRIGEEWNFRVEIDQSTLIGLLDEDDQVEIPERPWVDTWRKALKQLDIYPWHEMYPIDVHAEFRNRILKALKTRQKKGAAVEWSLWHLVLRIAPGTSADSDPYPGKTID